MKKTILLTAIACFATVALNAQTFDLTMVGNTTALNGTTQTFPITNSSVLHLDIDVVNTSGSQHNTIVSRKIITAPGASWEEQVCYGNAMGGGCFDINFGSTAWSSAGTSNGP